MNRGTLRALPGFVLALSTIAWSGDPATLTFAWPDGVRASVETRFTGTRMAGAAPVSWDVTSRYTITVRSDGSGVRVELAGFDGWEGTPPPSLGGAADRLIDTLQVLEIDRGGSFSGIAEEDRTRQLFREHVPMTNPREAPLMDSLTSDEGMRAVASDFWSMVVALWNGVEARPSEGFEIRNRTAVPQLGANELDIVGRARVDRVDPCARSGVVRRCATLVFRSAADAGQVTEIIENRLQFRPGIDARIVGMELSTDVTIVSEVETLLPHRITIRRDNAMTMEPPGGGAAVTGGERSTKEYVLSYGG